MSRRRNPTQVTEAVCTWQCDHPTRDDAFMCDQCQDKLSADLIDLRDGGRAAWRADEDLPGLWDELLVTVSGERGIDYFALAAGKSSGGTVGDDHEDDDGLAGVATGLVLNERAFRVGRDVRRALRSLVMACKAARLEHSAPAEQTLKSTSLVPAMSEWLSWRVDSIALHPEAAALAEDVHRAVGRVRWVIDRPEARQDLGECLVDGCDGNLSATPEDPFAYCDREGHAFDAQPLRDWLIAQLDDRLCTAAEIAHLSTYLGLRQDRTRVADLIRQWGKRERLKSYPPAPTALSPDPGPRYRFGDAHALLLNSGPRTTTNPSTDSKGA